VTYWRRWRGFWFPDGWTSLWWLLLALPPLYFFQTLVHEGSHALGTLFATGEFPKLAPFPHYNESFGSFLNGVAFTGGRGFVAIPQFLDLVLVIALSLVFVFWPIRNRFARYVLRTWYIGVSIDLLYNTVKGLWGGPSASSDWGKFQAETSTGLVVFVTWVMWLVVWSCLLWVYFSAWHRNWPARAGFWSYRWEAVLLGLLSLAAIVFSLAVNDPTIVKGHVFFILPLAVQIAGLGWYVTSVGMSFTRAS
jgi:hypothetical protein